MYITIDRKWLEENLDMLEEHYRNRIDDDPPTKRILINNGIEHNEPKVTECCFRDVLIEEKTDHIDVSLLSEVPLDIVARLIEDWKKKIRPFTNAVKEERGE